MNDKKKRLLIIGGVAGAVLIAVAAFGVYWFLKDDAPEEVSLETATAGLTSSTTDASGTGENDSTDQTTPPADGDIAGTWNVDLSLAEFDFEQTTGSFVGFRVVEELAGIGSNTAVGRTPDVSGSITIEGTTLTTTDIEADMTTLVTDDSRRDSRARGALGTDEFPTATFSLTEPVELGDNAADSVSVIAVGDLTVHGVTQEVEFDVDAQITDGVIVVTGTTEIIFADFGVEVPSAPVVVSAEDHGPIEFQLLLTKQA
jgi:polyisoprenoid-binding protein YceI